MPLSLNILKQTSNDISVLSCLTMNKIAGLVSLLSLTVAGEVRGCCDSVTLQSGGMGDFYQGSRLGKYDLVGTSSSGRGIYSQTNGANYLFYLVSPNLHNLS